METIIAEQIFWLSILKQATNQNRYNLYYFLAGNK